MCRFKLSKYIGEWCYSNNKKPRFRSIPQMDTDIFYQILFCLNVNFLDLKT
jgi:hypothetical protein